MNDLQLLHAYAERGDVAALSAVIQKHRQTVLATCWRKLRSFSDAEDASQEVFLSLIKEAPCVRTNVGAWLHRCAVNVSNSMLRARGKRLRRELERARLESPDTVRGDAVLQEQISVLDEILRNMDAEDHRTLLWNCVQGNSQEKIAAELGVSQQAISKRITRIVAQLRRQLRQRGVVAPAVLALLMALRRVAYARLPQRVIALVAKIPTAPEEPVVRGAVALKVAAATLILVSAVAIEEHHSHWRDAGAGEARGNPANTAPRLPSAGGAGETVIATEATQKDVPLAGSLREGERNPLSGAPRISNTPWVSGPMAMDPVIHVGIPAPSFAAPSLQETGGVAVAKRTVYSPSPVSGGLTLVKSAQSLRESSKEAAGAPRLPTARMSPPRKTAPGLADGAGHSRPLDWSAPPPPPAHDEGNDGVSLVMAVFDPGIPLLDSGPAPMLPALLNAWSDPPDRMPLPTQHLIMPMPAMPDTSSELRLAAFEPFLGMGSISAAPQPAWMPWEARESLEPVMSIHQGENPRVVDVPEPSSFLVLGSGIGTLIWIRRRRRA